MMIDNILYTLSIYKHNTTCHEYIFFINIYICIKITTPTNQLKSQPVYSIQGNELNK